MSVASRIKRNNATENNYWYTKRLVVNLRELRSHFITAALGKAGIDAQLGSAYLKRIYR